MIKDSGSKTIPFMVVGTRGPNYWVLGASERDKNFGCGTALVPEEAVRAPSRLVLAVGILTPTRGGGESCERALRLPVKGSRVDIRYQERAALLIVRSFGKGMCRRSLMKYFSAP